MHIKYSKLHSLLCSFWLITIIVVAIIIFGLSIPLSDNIKDESFIKSAWAKKITKPLAKGLEKEDLCVSCQPDKNIIQGQGLIVGTNYEDFIQGSFQNDQIFGKKGNDLILSDLGIDRVYGGEGDDSIQGSSGNDQLLGQDGDDDIFGGFDDDLLVGGKGNDHLFGDFGNDLLKGDSGADYFDCGEGLDKIVDFDIKDGDITAGNCEIL
jgi:hypothetical protein